MSNYTDHPLKTKVSEGITAWLQRTIPSTGARRVSSTALAVSTDIGTTRKENQDRAIIGFIHDVSEPVLFLALADGMGGMAQGGKCAAMTLAAFTAELVTSLDSRIETTLEKAAFFADYCVHKELQGNGGSTLSALIIKRGQEAITLNVGDSRIYAFTESSIRRLTRDDTIEEQFKGIVDSKIAEAEKHRILQYIGMGSDIEPHIEKVNHDLDDFLITSDGANICGSENLFKIKSNSENGTFVKRTTELSKWLGSHDNITALAASGLHDSFNQLMKNTEEKSVVIWDCFGERTQVIPEVSPEKPEVEKKPDSSANKNKTRPDKKKTAPKKRIKASTEPKSNDETKEVKELQIEFFKGTQGE